MNFNGNKLMVVEGDAALRARVERILTNAGYEVSAAREGELKSVVAFEPEVVIIGAEPLRVDCCDLLSEIKGSAKTNHIRVVLLAPGGPAERGRALDLGADDVLSLPFDEHELLARVRAHLREKHPEDDLRERINVAETRQESALEVIQAVNQQRQALKVGILALIVVAVLVTAGLALVSRRMQSQTARVYAAVNQLQSAVSDDEQATRLAQTTESEPTPSAAVELRNQRSGLTDKHSPAGIAKTTSGNVPDLKQQLKDADRRLQRLEAESRIAQDVIRSFSRSVCLIHVVVGFKNHSSGLPLRYLEVPSAEDQAKDPNAHSVLGFTGTAPEVHLDAFGTGFLISADGGILTNHHVIKPWSQDSDMDEIAKNGLDPVVIAITAYFPGVPHGIVLGTEKVSTDADLALVTGDIRGLSLKPLVLENDPQATVGGQPVVLLGYPTALDAILARADGDTVRSIAASASQHPERMVEEIARRGLIRPVNTQGHIGDVLPDRIIYDAQTTVGGSGGPLFNAQGKVIGVNYAALAGFGGSNQAIPVRYARSLVEDGSRRAQQARRSNSGSR